MNEIRDIYEKRCFFGYRRITEVLRRQNQKSIKSLKKQITTHKDKITNPSKYCQEWDTMDPRRQNALINKRWPAEIQCFTEERDILQTILEQMIENLNDEKQKF